MLCLDNFLTSYDYKCPRKLIIPVVKRIGILWKILVLRNRLFIKPSVLPLIRAHFGWGHFTSHSSIPHCGWSTALIKDQLYKIKISNIQIQSPTLPLAWRTTWQEFFSWISVQIFLPTCSLMWGWFKAVAHCSTVSNLFSDYLMQARAHTFLCSSTLECNLCFSVGELGALGIVAFQPTACCGWAQPPSEPLLETSCVVCTTAAPNTDLKIWWVLVPFWRCLDFWTHLFSDYRTHAFGEFELLQRIHILKKGGETLS